MTAATWARIADPAGGIGCLVATAGDDEPVGFATYVVHPRTWSTRPACYLEDLYVDSAARGRGAGVALVDRLVELCRAEGWDRLYWHTHVDNARARALYDRYARADDFVRYVLPVER